MRFQIKASAFTFLQRSVDGKHVMCFQSEASVFTLTCEQAHVAAQVRIEAQLSAQRSLEREIERRSLCSSSLTRVTLR